MVNITILCANRPRLLKQALDSIGDLSDATVTIRGAGMNEEVGQIANVWCYERFKEPPFTTYTKSSTPLGTGPARNHVVTYSQQCFGRGDFLYLSDDDVCFTRPDWLEVLIRAYNWVRSRGFLAIGAYNHPFNQSYETHILPAEYGGVVGAVHALASQSMLMSWDVWDMFGPFCDTPAGKVCQSEDVDFCNRICAAGYKVGVISPALLVNTGITNSFGEKIPGWELVKSQCPNGIICE